jgi:predicted ferric reductase
MGLYVAVALAPLGLGLLGAPPPGKGFLVDFSVALGFAGLSIMTLQFALSARFKRVAAPFGMDSMIQYHRQIGFVALLFVVAHPILLFVADLRYLALLDVTTSPLRAKFAVGATVALLLLTITSVWRKSMRMSYEAWQIAHGVLALLVVGGGLVHAVLVGRYLAAPWQRVLWLGLSVVVVGLLGWVRLVKPLSHYGRPWKVERVVPERGDACTLVLRPDGHRGFRFEPGQFAWVMVDRSPFSPTQHPFSISSSAEAADHIELTIKARGDFTRTISALKPGTRAYVEGPHGVFSPDRNEGPGFVLVGGGVGITPLVSIVRTMADREDPRPCLLFYASKDWDGVTFREELESLRGKMKLDIVWVLEVAPDGWEGEKGRIDAALLRRHLPKRFERLQYFVCGPSGMMDAMETALASIGVAPERVHTERFDMV